MSMPSVSATAQIALHRVGPLSGASVGGAQAAGLTPAQAKARASAQDFEGVFLNTMFQQMFTAVDGEGPFGGKGAAGTWRSFLTEEFAKSFTRAGGIGIADHVYTALLAQQETKGT